MVIYPVDSTNQRSIEKPGPEHFVVCGWVT